MPQVQVLQREPDHAAELIMQGGQNLANTLMERKRLELWKMQLAAQKANAVSDAAKQKFDRWEKGVKYALDINERFGGNVPEDLQSKILEGITYAVSPENPIEFKAAMGSVLGAPASPKAQQQTAQARLLNQVADEVNPAKARALDAQTAASGVNAQTSQTNAQANMLNALNGMAATRNQMRQLDIMAQNAKTNEERLAIDSERAKAQNFLDNTRAQLLSSVTQNVSQGAVADAGTESGEGVTGNGNPMLTALNVGGVNIAYPGNQARLEGLKKTAANEADLRSGKLTSEEAAIAAVAPESVKNLNYMIKRLSAKDLSLLQKTAIDLKEPLLAGKDIQDIQTAANNVKMVMNKMMSFGTQFTVNEERLVNSVMDLKGKTPENIQRSLGFIRNIFQRKTDLIKRGRAALYDQDPIEDKKAAFMLIASQKGFTGDQIDQGLRELERRNKGAR